MERLLGDEQIIEAWKGLNNVDRPNRPFLSAIHQRLQNMPQDSPFRNDANELLQNAHQHLHHNLIRGNMAPILPSRASLATIDNTLPINPQEGSSRETTAPAPIRTNGSITASPPVNSVPNATTSSGNIDVYLDVKHKVLFKVDGDNNLINHRQQVVGRLILIESVLEPFYISGFNPSGAAPIEGILLA